MAGTNSMAMACMYFTEFAENGSIYDYIHKEHKKPPLSQILLWAVQVAEGMYLRPIKKGLSTTVCYRGIAACKCTVPLVWYLLDSYVLHVMS